MNVCSPNVTPPKKNHSVIWYLDPRQTVKPPPAMVCIHQPSRGRAFDSAELCLVPQRGVSNHRDSLAGLDFNHEL